MDPAVATVQSDNVAASNIGPRIAGPRTAVARKSITGRKPVLQNPIPGAPVSNSTPTQLRKSVSSASSTPSTTAISTTNRSSITSVATETPVQTHVPATEELPAGWAAAIDPDGRKYYINHLTKATTWNKPEVNPAPLALGWEERSTPDGKIYYCNPQTNVTTWERPTLASVKPVVDSAISHATTSTAQTPVGDAPLPLWWEQRVTSDGKIYFCNTQTQTTQWERPSTTFSPVKAPSQDQPPSQTPKVPPLPADWEERIASDARVYYCNTRTQTTQWERPMVLSILQKPSVASSTLPTPTKSSTNSSPPSLSSEWEERRTSVGKVYYCNTRTQTTQWERPTVLPKLQTSSIAPVTLPLSNNVSSDGSLSPLSSEWEERKTSDGKTYYCNTQMQTTQWDRPTTLSALKTPSAASNTPLSPTNTSSDRALSPLSSEWEERRTSEGKVYYCNTLKNTTQWERPDYQSGTEFPFPTSIPEGSRSLGAGNTSTPVSPSLEWETPSGYDKSSRRKSTFSMRSLGSHKMKLPKSAPSSNAMIQGTKIAAEKSMKGMKSAGKIALKNKGVILVTLKVANTILRETTGLDLGGLEGLFEGGGEDLDCGIEDEGEDDEIGVVCGEEDGVPEEEAPPEDEVVVISEEEVPPEAEVVVVPEGYEAAEEFQPPCAEDETVIQEEAVIEESTYQEELTAEQQAAFSGAFAGESMWTEETVFVETAVIEEEGCVSEEQMGGQQETITQEGAFVQQETIIQEGAVTQEEVVVQEEVIIQEETITQEEVVQPDGTTDVQTTVTETVMVQETTIVEETTTQEVVCADGTSTVVESQEVTVEESVVVATETQYTETVMPPPTSDYANNFIVEEPMYEPIPPPCEPATIEPPPPVDVPVEPPFSGYEQVCPPPAAEVPMEPFIFQPILAGPMMVEPPRESNGVIFDPIYV